MTDHSVAIAVLLALTTLSCVIGVLGMWRMRQPTQALQYLSFPATVGMVCVTIAVFLQTGFGQAGMKCVAIIVILVSINSVVAHATARAFYIRRNRGGKSLSESDWNFLDEGRQ